MMNDMTISENAKQVLTDLFGRVPEYRVLSVEQEREAIAECGMCPVCRGSSLRVTHRHESQSAIAYSCNGCGASFLWMKDEQKIPMTLRQAFKAVLRRIKRWASGLFGHHHD